MIAVGHRARSRYLDDGPHSQPPPADIDVAILSDSGIDHGGRNANVENNDADMSTDEESGVEADGDRGCIDDDDELCSHQTIGFRPRRTPQASFLTLICVWWLYTTTHY